MLNEKELERFLDKVSMEPNSGCWLWTGTLQRQGYGRFYKVNKQPAILAHRVAFEHFVGPIPTGLELDHLCRVKGCVNPKHLEAVTHAENMRRWGIGDLQKKKTHCPHGHPYEGDNLVRKGNRRVCRTCKNEQLAATRGRYTEDRKIELQDARSVYLASLPEEVLEARRLRNAETTRSYYKNLSPEKKDAQRLRRRAREAEYRRRKKLNDPKQHGGLPSF